MNIFKKYWVTFAELDTCCGQIAEVVKTFQPDSIVSIESGGWYVGHLLEKKLLVPHHSITIRRPIDLKKLYRGFPRALRLVPTVWQGVLFMCKKPALQEKLSDLAQSMLVGKKVLLVDDVLHSGKTLSIAIDYLQSIGVTQIQTAVIGNVHGFSTADYYCRKGICYFPWSHSSIEYSTYLSLREQLTPQL